MPGHLRHSWSKIASNLPINWLHLLCIHWAAGVENKSTAHDPFYNHLRGTYFSLCVEIRSTDENLFLIAVFSQAFDFDTILRCFQLFLKIFRRCNNVEVVSIPQLPRRTPTSRAQETELSEAPSYITLMATPS